MSSSMDPALRRAVGGEIRRMRLERAMTQEELGRPLTRAFVSAVEAGRTIPSLPALQHLVDRLGVPMSAFFERVEDELSNGT
jgi:transcriptional regulator with XRE-family HTH domain